MRKRKYNNYQEYLIHQARKGDIKLQEYINEGRFPIRVSMFLSQFIALIEELSMKPNKILCIGARYGEEVVAWKQLGYGAIGIDINPGPNNKNVVVGDFHDLHWPDNSFEYIWSNAMDHALYLDKMLKEAHRVLKPSGTAIFECKQHLPTSIDEPIYWEAVYWESQKHIIDYFKNLNIWKSIYYYPMKFFIQRGIRLTSIKRPCIIVTK